MRASLAFLLFISFLPSQLQALHIWSRRVGGPGNCQVRSIALDASGNVVVTGGFLGNQNFGGQTFSSGSDYNIFVAKYDAVGNHIWSYAFGSTTATYDTGVDLAIDGSGFVLVTGQFAGSMSVGQQTLTSDGSQEIFLIKLDANGVPVWSASYGDVAEDYGQAVVVDAAGNVIITGRMAGTVDFGGGPLGGNDYNGDIFIAKYTPAGAHLWSKRFGLGSSDWGQAVEVDENDNVVVSGFFYSSIDFGGGLRSSVGLGDVFLVKYAPNGAHIWSRAMGGPYDDYVSGMCVDPSDGITLTGSFQGSIDMGNGSMNSEGARDVFLAGYDTGGNHEWSRRLGGPGHDQGYSVVVDALGNLAVTGEFFQTVDFGGGPITSVGSDDAFIAFYDAAGNHRWSHGFGYLYNDKGYAVVSTSLGNILFGGSTIGGTVNFGGNPIGSGGFLAEFEGSTPSTDVDKLPVSSINLQAFPNPFNPATSLLISVTQPLVVQVDIHDVTGTLVRALYRGSVPVGTSRLGWDGKNDRGFDVGSGVYFCRVSTSERVVTAKLTLLK